MTRRAGVALRALAVAALVGSTAVPLAPAAGARAVACDEPATRRVSVSSDEAEARRDSETPSISGDGRFVAFASAAGNLVPGDDNDAYDVFVRDRLLGTTEIVSVATGGEIGNASSLLPAISVTGRFVAFNSIASNFAPGDVDPTLEEALDVFIHDRETHVTERVSVDSNGDPRLAPSFGADVSASGRFVAFTSAGALAPDDANATYDVYVRDRTTGTTELVSIAEDGVHQNLSSWFPSISGSGRFVAFDSSQDRLVPNDTNRWNDVFVKDRVTGAIERVSVDSDGRQGRGGSTQPDITRDGRLVVFASEVATLVPRDTNGRVSDVFVHNRLSGRTRLFSKSSTGRQSAEMSFGGSISDDGKRVAFSSPGAGLVARDTNGTWDVFVRDRVRQRTRRVSVGPNRREAIGNREPFYSAWISADGSAVAFESLAGNLIGRDTNGRADIFVRGRPASCALAAP